MIIKRGYHFLRWVKQTRSRQRKALVLAGLLAAGTMFGLGYYVARNIFSIPEFARKPYEPFTRDNAVAIALREWRMFGSPVHDEAPNQPPLPPAPEQAKAEREPGLWQRVGEYCWIGLNPDSILHDVTGKHTLSGEVFPAEQDSEYPWSAAFISYVMRIAGAGSAFPYSETHSDYINTAWEASQSAHPGNIALRAEPPTRYQPQPGDLICFHPPNRKGPARFEDLPAGHFNSHCDIVVERNSNVLSVIGGNVHDQVAMKHVPVTPYGMLTDASGLPLDTRYQWFVVLRVLYAD